jgi:hypothetical protein
MRKAATVTDIGNAHVIQWYLHHERQAMIKQWDACARGFAELLKSDERILRFDPEDWSRYDGELQ